jgi:hypothetical protein
MTFAYAIFEGTPLPIVLVVGFSPIVMAILGYGFLLIFDRDKLQSEDYQIRKRSLEMIEQSDGLRTIDPKDIQLIANPLIGGE